MPAPAPKTEQILFQVTPPGGQTQSVELIVNPETLTLLWKKVLNRRRTKTRLVTLFWGESPVKFAYRGQTGYAYPTITEINSQSATQTASMQNQQSSLTQQITKLQSEITAG